MSFGFGFALPAYPLRGGGGNNPFNQSGPTLDLSFAGVVTDLSDPNGYTLNTNFITPQYQVAAQYVVWETGVGLVDKTFSQIVTFSRTSGATWFNSAGVNVGIDFSTSSVAIGTGSKTFTLTATAGVDRSWTAGDIVRISEQATPANFMDGTVTSYTASTQTLVVNVTATGGSGTIASWRVSNWMPRFDYNPATLAAQGLLIEEARTNSIRNNTMQGAVAGTPGTVPTNWTISSPTGNLTTREIVGIGTEDGITYIDVRFVTSGAFTASIYADTSTGVAASNGQTWTGSFYVKLAGGSLTNVTTRLSIVENDSSGNFLAGNDGTIFILTTSALSTQRYTITRTNTNASTAYEQTRVRIDFSGAGDITLRIGLPQLEQGAFATSVIPTTTTALTRSADAAFVNTLSPWFNSTEYTLYHEGMVLTNDNGIVYSGLGDTFDNTAYLTRSAPNQTAGVRSGGVAVAAMSINTTPSSGVPFKMAMKVKANDFAFCVNGGTVATDTSGAVPVSTVRLGIGNSPWTASGGNGRQQWVRRITFYPRGLSSAELQTITA